ncbi:MAG: magnesium transporter [Opitutaceae bacterium]|nr:magnesium transporter [Cytophagales bacterium]
MQFELTKEFLEEVRDLVQAKDSEKIRATLDELYPADITSVLYELDGEECKYVFNILDKSLDAQILSYIDEDTRTKFLKNFESKEIAEMMEFVDSDDAADILNEQPLRTREEVIGFIENKEKAQNILDLLRYEENTAGAIMAKEFVVTNVNWNVKHCIEEIRNQTAILEKLYTVYVVDQNEALVGHVSLKKIILATDYTKLLEIAETDVIYVETWMKSEEVADIMQKYDLDSIPVVNVQKKLVGMVTIDDVVDIIKERQEMDRQAMAGITEDIEEDDSVWMLTRARLPWLLIGMVGGLTGASFIGLFEKNLTLIPAMAFFIPLITATGGNVGVQSSSIVVQSLANRTFFEKNLGHRLIKVLMVGLINGLVLALLVFLANITLGQPIKLAFVVSIALLSVVMLASVMGTITPLVLDNFGINPAVASGPFITTTNDLLGLGVYFSVASMLYSL